MTDTLYDSIIPIGCSHMYGYEHASTENNQKPSVDTWVNIIGKHLNLPVYNFSKPGGSNQSVLRRLYFAIEFAKTKKLNPLFVLQWTSYERYETYVQSAYYKCQEWPWLRTLAELLDNSRDKNLKAWAKSFYKIFEDQTLFFESLKAIDHANVLLKSNNYKTINCLAQGWNLELLDIPYVTHYISSSEIERNSPYNSTAEKIYVDKNFLLNKEMEKQHDIVGYISKGYENYRYEAFFELLWKNIDSYAWWHYDSTPYTVGLKKFCIKNNLELGPEGHPMESANLTVAKYLLNNKSFNSLL